MQVVALDPALEDVYRRFLLAQEDSLLYHSLPWRDLIAEHLGARPEYLLAVSEDRAVLGALPLMWLDLERGSVANSLPYYGSHGSVLGSDPDARGALIEAWNERARRTSTLSATLVANPFSSEHLVPPVHNLNDVRIGQATLLPRNGGDPADALLRLIDSSARRNVRKALREGIEVERDHREIDTLAAIHRDNIEALGGLAKSRDFFDAIGRHFEPGAEYDVWIARLQDEVVAALLVFYFNGTVEYLTPAVVHDHRSRQPLAAVLARALAHAIERDLRRWNWGGTWEGQTGVSRFKRKWGARDCRYEYFVQLNDRSLVESSAAELRQRFGHFYVLPFSILDRKGAA